MPSHTSNVPRYIDAEHTLVLTDAEAYQIWYLSYQEEGGDGFPHDPFVRPDPAPAPRIHKFFDGPTHARFEQMAQAGMYPVDYLAESRKA